MIKLNLTAKDSREQTVLENLIPMVSETLADKINNGVYIEKDGKRLLNKKDLSTFMDYAAEQAKNTLAENQRTGKQAVCVHGDDIMSWAIHYFEEESIEGKLYNEDGTEYKPVVKPTAKPVTTITPPKPTPKPQLNIFDMLSSDKSNLSNKPNDHEPVDVADNEDNGEELNSNYTPEEPAAKAEQHISAPIPQKAITTSPATAHSLHPVYEHYLKIQSQYPDSIIAYRLGDFYEVFGENAKLLSDELDLTLTGRDFGLDSRIPLVGFPHHAMDKYILKIINKGHKIALAEDLNDIRVYEVNGETGEIISTETDDEALITVSELLGETPIEENTDTDDLLSVPPEANDNTYLQSERQNMKAFDIEAMLILQELLDNKITLV